MSRSNPTNIAASVHQRLINLARTQGRDVNLTLTRYGLERFLYRLSRSPHTAAFVLTGAMLFYVWTGPSSRPTRDVDLLVHLPSDADEIRRVFQNVCLTQVEDDGLVFRSDMMEIEPTQDLRRFGGLRVTIPVRLGNTRLQVQVDLGFGDAITPEPHRITYPTLLDQPAPKLAAYHMETAIAEKTEAIVKLGIANTRTKDYFDLLTLSRRFAFNGAEVVSSMLATFRARVTAIPDETPVGLADRYGGDVAARTRWRSFHQRNDLPEELTWADAVAAVRAFIVPPLNAAEQTPAFGKTWTAGGPWQDSG